MTDDDRIQALLDIVDPERQEAEGQGDRLVVLGLATRRGRGFWPTVAGWNLMGDAGRPFDPQT